MKAAKCIYLIVLLMMTVILTACSEERIYEGDSYSLSIKGDDCYLRVKKSTQDESHSGNYSMVDFAPTFSSVEEMREALLNGNITAEGLESLMRYSDTDTVETCNPNQLYNIKAPEGFGVSHVTLYQNLYYFGLDTLDSNLGYLECFF